MRAKHFIALLFFVVVSASAVFTFLEAWDRRQWKLFVQEHGCAPIPTTRVDNDGQRQPGKAHVEAWICDNGRIYVR